MVSRPVRIPARHFAIVPTKCPNMFTGRLKLALARNFKTKSQICTWNQCSTIIPTVSGQKYSLHDINLEHERDVYLGKDTILAYAREEDKSCDYLE